MAMNIPYELPDELIQHIQSFLDGKEAARTCLLSKSWYCAWSTIPILDFETQSLYNIRNQEKKESILKRMERYKTSNINLQKFKCKLHTVKELGWNANFNEHIYNTSIVDALIRDASKLGVKEIHLDSVGDVPASVFDVTSLTKLYICGLELPEIDNRVRFLQLVSLHLNSVVFHNNHEIQDILSQCPLLENLDLKYVSCRDKTINLGGLHNLVYLRACNSYKAGGVNVSFESVTNKGGVLVDSVPESHKLRVVCLEKVEIKGGFFTNFSSRFPCIEDLSLENCDGYQETIQISSKSLRYFKIHDKFCYGGLEKESVKVEKAEFDVPNIRKFVFKTPCGQIPSLSFHTVSKECESEVELSCFLTFVERTWFVNLREFLKELSSTRISLAVFFSKKCGLIWVKDLPCSSTPAVESLLLTPRLITHDLLLYTLLRCCRPTFIKMGCQNLYGYSCAKLLQDLFIINQNISNYANRFDEMQSLLIYDLEEIDVDTLKENKWQYPTPLTKFVRDVHPVRISDYSSLWEMWFRFKWGAFRCVKAHEDIPSNKESIKSREYGEN